MPISGGISRPPIDAAFPPRRRRCRDAVALHQRNGDAADDDRVGGAAAADRADGSEPSTAVCGTICRLPGEPAHDIDHRALRAEAARRRGQQQEGGDQGERELAVDPVDAGGNSTVLDVTTR
jgi:hypothetical protein